MAIFRLPLLHFVYLLIHDSASDLSFCIPDCPLEALPPRDDFVKQTRGVQAHAEQPFASRATQAGRVGQEKDALEERKKNNEEKMVTGVMVVTITRFSYTELRTE